MIFCHHNVVFNGSCMYCLGRVHHALNNHSQAVEYLRQGLTIAEQLGRREDEAKIRHRLGLSLWGKGDLDECQQQLYRATDLFESIRRDGQLNSEYKMSLFDLQTACYQALQVKQNWMNQTSYEPYLLTQSDMSRILPTISCLSQREMLL